jgi:hypothetical protein
MLLGLPFHLFSIHILGGFRYLAISVSDSEWVNFFGIFVGKGWT